MNNYPKFIGISKNKNFEKIIRDIISLKIQGSVSVAVFSVKAMEEIAKKSPANHLAQNLLAAKERLAATRPTEPLMRNALALIAHGLSAVPEKSLKKEVFERIKKINKYFSDSSKKITHFGAGKIKKGMTVYTHCHSSTVINIIKEAKKRRKKIFVCNTETRPMFQGRKTARELAKAGIPVEHYVDSEMRLAIRKSDIVLLGADAISTSHVYNKIGSEVVCELAGEYKIPVYICSHALKFDPATLWGISEKIEQRSTAEIWKDAPHGISVKNYAFEKINNKLITGIISELGILPPKKFLAKLKKTYPFLFV